MRFRDVCITRYLTQALVLSQTQVKRIGVHGKEYKRSKNGSVQNHELYNFHFQF